MNPRAKTKIAARISRAMVPQVVVLAWRASRRRESVPPDSRVLCPKAAVNEPAQASAAKLFSCGETGTAGAVTRAKTSTADARCVCARQKFAPRDAVKSRISSALLLCRDFLARVRVAAKNSRRAFYRARAARARASAGAALTHKIKQSHCYFSPAVVIGCQCWSIRDRTASMIAIHSS